ncbi:MAG: PAS domain S-box protein [Firmicutes bacterium]|nr:PAS domain S-box protein [Bacillota bacterium]
MIKDAGVDAADLKEELEAPGEEAQRLKKAETLKESEQSMADAFDLLPDPTFAINLNGEVTIWNRAIEKMTGISAADMIGKGNYEYALPFYGIRRPMVVDLVLRPDEQVEKSYTVIKKQKGILVAEGYINVAYGEGRVYASGQGNPLYDSEGNLIGAIESFRDINHIKCLEVSLRESERRLNEIINFLPDATFAIDSEGRVIIWNKAIEEMTGVKASEIMGRGGREYARYFYGSNRPMLIDLVLNPGEDPDNPYPVFVRKGDAIEAEGFVRVAFGNGWAYIWGKAGPLHDGQGRFIGAIESLHDITEKKLLDESLREQREWFKTTLESIGDAVIATDQQSRITFMNQIAEELTGYSLESACGRPISEVFNIINQETGEPAAIPTDKVLRDGVIVGLANHTSLVAKDGTVRPIADSAAPIRNGEGKTVGVVLVFRDESERQQSEMALRRSEEQFRSLVENMNDVFFRLDEQGRFVYISSGVENLGKFKQEHFIGLNIFDFVHPEDLKRVRAAFHRNLNGRPRITEFRIVTQEGVKYVTVSSKLAHEDGVPYVFGVLTDITQRKLAELELEKSEKLYRAMVMDQSEMILRFLHNGEITFVNNSLCGLFGFKMGDLIGLNVASFLHPHEVERIRELLRTLGQDNPTTTYETPLTLKNGEMRWVQWVTRRIIYETGVYEYQSVGRDITDRLQVEKKLMHMSLHDNLTGLNNRAFFEEAMQSRSGADCFPLGIIVCDLDGLKLVNDTFGHHSGDKMLTEVGSIMRKCFRKDDVVARIGGDEFAVILTATSAKDVENSCRRILETVDGYNKLNPDLPVNLSVGYAVTADRNTSIADLFKEADNNMYREKLHRSQSTRSAIVNTLMKTLEARDIITNDHSLRIQDLLINLARSYNFPKRKLNDLKLLAKFHDIGKVGIPDRILLKPGPLTMDEKSEMQRHCEIGHRIVLAASDLAPIADWIIKHHEWWNGEGYPLRIKEDEIPLECRMLAVIDAYEAMVSDRPYRKAMSFEDAINELKRCAGTQFDPGVVQKFIRIVRPPRKRKKPN